MTKRRKILVLAVCFLVAFLAAQALSQARRSNGTPKVLDAERQRKMSDTQRQREAAKRRAAKRLELEGEQRRKDLQEKTAEARREFLFEKRALASTGLTEEQWKVIKARLEKVAKFQNLRELEGSTSGVSLGGSSGSGTDPKANTSQSEPRWQWDRPWKDNASAELSEAQKIAEELIGLLEKKNAMPEEFRQKMDALRKARNAEEAEKKKREKELSEARQELCKGLTTRQEATLVLMGRL